MPIREKDIFGNKRTRYQWFDNALNPALLQEIAGITHGKFYRVTDADTLDAVFREIDLLEKSKIKAIEKVRYEEAFQRPLELGLGLLLLEQVLARGWWRWVP